MIPSFNIPKPDRNRMTTVADILAALLAASLPWSTSATGILAALWLIAVFPTLDMALLRNVLWAPAGGMPVVLWGLGLIGMLWATDIPFMERVEGLNSFHKLLFIPLLIVHFERSERAAWALYLYFASCAVLLLASWYLVFAFGLEWRGNKTPGVPVKDYISQSGAFLICVFLAGALAQEAWRRGRIAVAVALLVSIPIVLANVAYVSISRTALVVIPVLAVLFAIVRLTCRQAAVLAFVVLLSVVLTWSSAQKVRSNITGLFHEISHFDPHGINTRAGERMTFWIKSIDFIAAAPLIGHGTGSIHQQFHNASEGQMGMAGLKAANPHNQVLAVAIQLGLLGALVLLAMWVSHAWMFRLPGFASWAGLVIVVQNFVGSLFNSHLFDFTQGWTYVIGVGIVAGLVRKTAQAVTR